MANTALTKNSVVLTHTASPSSASSIEFTGLSSDYFAYRIMLTNLDPSADCSLNLRTSTDGGSSYDSGVSDYSWVRVQVTTTLSNSGDTADSEITFFDTIGGSSANESASGHLWIFQPSATEYCRTVSLMMGATSASGVLNQLCIGVRQSAANVDAFQILPSTGTITGEIRVYGYKNA